MITVVIRYFTSRSERLFDKAAQGNWEGITMGWSVESHLGKFNLCLGRWVGKNFKFKCSSFPGYLELPEIRDWELCSFPDTSCAKENATGSKNMLKLQQESA